MIFGYDLANPKLIFIGGIGLLFWLLDFFKIFKTAELKLPAVFFAKKKAVSFLTILSFVTGIIAWGLISISMGQPRKPLGHAEAEKELNDIYFVVDVSRSMLAGDFPPNRLEAAKDRIRNFIDLSPVDRIGIVMFADKVFTLIPATVDLELVKQSVDQIRIGFLGNGTNIGDALGLAVARSVTSIAENKTIVLLTDGASNVGLLSPVQAAEKAKEKNIKVYTIGIGGDKDAKLPTGRDIFGNQQYQNIPGGSMDFETLEKIAQISGGKSFIASNSEALDNVLQEINKLERKKIEISGRVIYEELYWYFLILGTFLLIVSESTRVFLKREVY
ncbi:VWA domain-containing protein [Bacteriovorax sp. Seq25_V]|uniref:VWA domain-containing protein n=1 Tax=Bacteriovorax sp. Seq25_V TaxID=1201288 RepID=UPI00038A03EF|nr:VWA domain-containing protein [Bacteriovorax sp. Seq25_V]EQC43549.1 Ssl1-like protein [Bacteriovorax sp. Seq25_V]